MGSNVQLIDPLLPNVPSYSDGDNRQPIFENGIPPYEDMHIYAELVAERRGRTVLETNNKGLKPNLIRTGLESDVSINFLGFNQNDDSPDDGKFTTRYYDGSVSDGIQHDSFGITKIKTLINSSYIPQIDIEFTDVRGLAFFNREESPYRILFDFPPPIFYLTIKGYYGKALEYQLHLVKYTTDFNSDTGNYIINAKFVAITYAPLTDVLFKYILNFGLIRRNDISIDLNNTKPKTTFELIQKLKILYDEIKNEVKESEDNEDYEKAILFEERVNDLLLILNNYNNLIENVNKNIKTPLKPVLFIQNTEGGDNFGNIEVINNVREFDSIIQSEGTLGIPVSTNKKLYVGIFILGKFTKTDSQIRNDENQIDALELYKEKLKSTANDKLGNGFITDNDFGDVELIQSTPTWGELNQQVPPKYLAGLNKIKDDDTEIIIWYRAFNITDYYIKIFKEKSKYEEEKNVAANTINEKVNALITKRLGMLPTIYNVFKIILDDVDHFFQTMRDTAISAEVHHNDTYRDVILSNAGDNYGDKKNQNDKLYSFPLVLKQEEACGAIKKVKIAPVALSDSLPEEFPEIELLDDFIRSFIIYNDVVQLQNIKNQKGNQGEVKWLPCHPTDTKLFSSLPNSPYIGIDNPLSQSLNIDPDNQLNKFLKIVLNRYYIISQNTIRDYFIRNIDNESKVFVDLYADSEAINLANSIISQELANYILNNFRSFRNYDNFISYLNNNNTFNDLYDFNNEYVFRNASNGPDLYVDRSESNYEGFKIKDSNISLRQVGGDDENPIDVFMNNIKEKHWEKQNKVRGDYKFTDSNLIYFPDGGATTKDNYSFRTKFIAANYKENYEKFFKKRNLESFANKDFVLFEQRLNVENQVFTVFNRKLQTLVISANVGRRLTYETQNNSEFRDIVQELAISGGHRNVHSLFGFPYDEFKKNINFSNDIIPIWAIELTLNGDYVVNLNKYGNGNINNDENKFIRSLIYLSSFGWAQSPFSRFPYGYNLNLFQIPAVVEMPFFILAYMGALVNIKGTENYDNLIDFFSGNDFDIDINQAVKETNVLNSAGYYILSDIHDIDTYLSDNDKETLKDAYDDFMDFSFSSVDNEIRSIYNNVIEEAKDECYVSSDEEDRLACRTNKFDEQLRDSEIIFRTLMDRKILINYNTITFNTEYGLDSDNNTYISLNDINQEQNSLATNTRKFFETFINETIQDLEERITFLEEKEKEFNRSVDDTDIYTQTYYSFKNINDKWLAGLNKNISGYPFKDNGEGALIDQFVFVDRALNPIGDTIIDLKTLLDLEYDTKTSIFTVLTQLLSVNGFEFFPLQNFMTFEENEWEKSFTIDNGPIEKQYPTFVCMYIGGTASYPSGTNDYYEEDGIVDLENPEVADFSTQGCEPNEELDNQVPSKEGKFYYAQPKAFKVRFGEQNQSMFRDIQIDSKEYPETNESLSILGQIAGDGSEQAPIPKGQNLYNLYENRSYKATIRGLGNVMIQPTQYFQLENVPLFNGAYVVLEVEHDVSQNKMETSFSGTKLLKYPLPRVTDPATLFGFQGGATDNTQPSFDTVSEGIGTASNPPETQFNDFYYLSI